MFLYQRHIIANMSKSYFIRTLCCYKLSDNSQAMKLVGCTSVNRIYLTTSEKRQGFGIIFRTKGGILKLGKVPQCQSGISHSPFMLNGKALISQELRMKFVRSYPFAKQGERERGSMKCFL